MTALIIDGRQTAMQVRGEIRETVAAHVTKGFRAPALAVILVGEDAASAVYVRNKRLACKEAGVHSLAFDLPAETSETALITLIDSLNASSEVDGILVQLPLPSHINTDTIIERINPKKDVDGFHPYNLGRLAQKRPALRPCTPFGIMHLLEAAHIPLTGAHAVVVGASNIVGRPMALEFLLVGATVTVCHSQTVHLRRHVEMADILVVAAGQMGVVDTAWLKPHQVVIDVGMHRLDDGRLRGDVDFEAARALVAAVTPVPGGVGPMTVAMLLHNTLQAAGVYQHAP
ncbi:Bifunctional protein FolD protein [Legionella geestiana]|uniref:Bifunctional protein FolD n=1 Tax=Legionella geestiana TaxID=45065 RepID=A0A0W0TYI8_9GAMM|nr:bifunctional methylenetetrahydrofolate dehydrogenase/methenyltetrahydrofolate cyclohydrolase FolD [Legionella geestiana]KTD00734.1 Bifunctional protein FolD protein [Legionella geestiana]QBS11591.1 bifunctional methylenetetrahydrofolate dehydrogenase/methenyltetrahydrofolate cyclohydrolase FolD [Legionella geestiana]QDQ40800.1 bifunctional methylenetetrahydrofolate dehydrogenase/methenyltetrahydrofolate cyclohydrolase FolD [Legionella geestiana]STX53731.1 methenyltetrahydrofolate cyclohydrol